MGKGYNCIQNTYNFHLSSSDDVRGDAGCRTDFRFSFPQLPTLTRSESKTAIFRLKCAIIGKQNQTNNVSNNDAIFIQIDGLSIRPQNISNGVVSNRFMIPNQKPDSLVVVSDTRIPEYDVDGDAAAGDGAQGGNQVVATYDISALNPNITFNSFTGGELSNPYECICGNPTGNTEIRVSLFKQDNTPLTASNGNLNQLDFHMTFDIELITPEQDQNL